MPVMCRARAVRLLKGLPSYSKPPSAVTTALCSRPPHSREMTVPGTKCNSREGARLGIFECAAPMRSRRSRVAGGSPPKASSCSL